MGSLRCEFTRPMFFYNYQDVIGKLLTIPHVDTVFLYDQGGAHHHYQEYYPLYNDSDDKGVYSFKVYLQIDYVNCRDDDDHTTEYFVCFGNYTCTDEINLEGEEERQIKFYSLGECLSCMEFFIAEEKRKQKEEEYT